MATRVEIEADRELDIEEVWLGDDGPMEFAVPKMAPVTNVISKRDRYTKDEFNIEATAAQSRWLEQGFTEEDWQHIQDRLNDPNDPLDFKHLTALFQQLMERDAGRPTMSSRGSRPTPAKRHSVERQKRQELTSVQNDQDSSAI